MGKPHKDDVEFVDWMEKTIEEQGRKWIWLCKQIDMMPHDMSYKRSNYTFTVDEENSIKEILDAKKTA